METWSKKKEAAAAAIVKATFPFPFFHEENEKKTMNGAQMCASKLYYKNW